MRRPESAWMIESVATLAIKGIASSHASAMGDKGISARKPQRTVESAEESTVRIATNSGEGLLSKELSHVESTSAVTASCHP